MSKIEKRERLKLTLEGGHADRPPIAAWQHQIHAETNPEEFIRETVRYQKRYDWDILKVNPRAVVFTEAWGNRYDYSNYIGLGPACVKAVLCRTEDLYKIRHIDCGKGSLGEQVEIIGEIRQLLEKEVPILQTIFSPIAILLNLTGTRMIGRNRKASREESPIVRYMKEDPKALHWALQNVADTLVSYIELLYRAGADGIFYTSLGLAREGYLTYEEWEEYCKKYDLYILEKIERKFVIFHTCGIYANPERFTDYPISVLHWAQSAEGNPGLQGAKKWLHGLCAMGGVDEDLFGANGANNEKEIFRQAENSLKTAKDEKLPFFLAPECSVSPNTTQEEYEYFRGLVER